MEGQENIEQEKAALREKILSSDNLPDDFVLEAEIARVKDLAETLSTEDGSALGEVTELDALIAISFALEHITDGEPDYAGALENRARAVKIGNVDPMPYMVEGGVVHTDPNEMRE